MNWIQKHVEHAILLACLLFLAGVSLTLALTHDVKPPEESFSGKEATPDPINAAEFAGAKERLDTGNTWSENTNTFHEVFISRPMEWLRDEQKLIPFDPEKPDPYGIPRSWRRMYGFPPGAPDLALQDPDGDSFLNVEEYCAGTHPKDKSSTPPKWKKLQLVDVVVVPYPIRFLRYEDIGQQTQFGINFDKPRPKEKRSNFVVKDEAFGPWKVLGFQKKEVKELNPATGQEETLDKSEVQLANLETGEKLTLVLNKILNYSYVNAAVLNAYLGSNEKKPATLGATVVFDGIGTYTVTDLSKDPASVFAVLTDGAGQAHKVFPPPTKESYKGGCK